jgi:hypothetical protein
MIVHGLVKGTAVAATPAKQTAIEVNPAMVFDILGKIAVRLAYLNNIFRIGHKNTGIFPVSLSLLILHNILPEFPYSHDKSQILGPNLLIFNPDVL